MVEEDWLPTLLLCRGIYGFPNQRIRPGSPCGSHSPQLLPCTGRLLWGCIYGLRSSERCALPCPHVSSVQRTVCSHPAPRDCREPERQISASAVPGDTSQGLALLRYDRWIPDPHSLQARLPHVPPALEGSQQPLSQADQDAARRTTAVQHRQFLRQAQ